MTRKDLGFIVFFICLGVLALWGLGIIEFYEVYVWVLTIPFIAFLGVGGVCHWIDGDRKRAVAELILALWIVVSNLGKLEIIYLPPSWNLWEVKKWRLFKYLWLLGGL